MIPDAVHPDVNGQAVMAFALLEQMSANRQVSAVTATNVNDKWRVARPARPARFLTLKVTAAH